MTEPSVHPEQRRRGPADAPVAAAVGERPAAGEHRPMRDEVEDEVVRLDGAGEVLAAIVDHLVGTQRPHELQLAGVVDPGDVRADALGELDRERARAATGPVDQHPLSGAAPAVPCSAIVAACGIVEASANVSSVGLGASADAGAPHTRRSRPSVQGCRRTPRRRPGSESHPRRWRRPTRRDPSPACGVPAQRAAQPRCNNGEPPRHSQSLKVDRCRGHPDEHLPEARRRGRDVVDSQHLGRSISVVDNRSHATFSSRL